MSSNQEQRNRFLRLAKDFDDNYVSSDVVRNETVNKNKKPYQTNKEFLQQNDFDWYLYSQLNYIKLRDLVNNVEKTGKAFKGFYDFDDENLYFLFHSIHITKLFLLYFEKYQFDRLRKYAEKQSLVSKYESVIEDSKALNVDENHIKVLEDRKNNLHRTFPTEQNIFENFLHSIHIILVKRGKDATHNLTDTTCNVVNLIIKNYFDRDVTFSRATNFETFEWHIYRLESLKEISLLHKRNSNR